MSEKDMTEKALEAYNDVFADIVNNLIFMESHMSRRKIWNRGGSVPFIRVKKLSGNRNVTFPSIGRKRTSGLP